MAGNHQISSLLSLSSEESEIKYLSKKDASWTYINVYRLKDIDESFKSIKSDIILVGVEVHGIEWSYGSHRFPFSGIFRFPKSRDVRSLSKNERLFELIQNHRIGTTRLPLEHVQKHISEMGMLDWTGLKYHLAFKNSIHFARSFCNMLGLNPLAMPDLTNFLVVLHYKYPRLMAKIPADYSTPLALREWLAQMNYKI